jgi:microcystin-dependent protein
MVHMQRLSTAMSEAMMSSSSEAIQANNSVIPAGMVFPYAGTYSESVLSPGGWLLCDGRLMTTDQSTQQLFNAIGTVNGGTGAKFNLPDYRGVFLRGVAGKASADPDKDARTAVTVGAASGNNVGSFQGYATALPQAKEGLTVSVKHLPQSGQWAYVAGVKFDVAVWVRTGDMTATSAAGGDSESRPQNIYVDFILQSQIPTTDALTLPAGVLVSMIGVSAPGSGWLLCNGQQLNSADYPDLFAAIGTSHGGTAPKFNAPDLRGRFLRGRAETSHRDPDCAQRTSSAPGGNTGNQVGSLQGNATGLPINAFTAKLEHCPQASSEVGKCAGNAETAWNPGSVGISFAGHWDNETRPVNLYVDWYVKVDAKSNELPVGSIVAVAGNESPGNTYLLCDGSSCKVKDYPDLFAVIGTLNGGDGSSLFNVPDCRGKFLRGVDHGALRDPDASGRAAAASGGQSGDNPGSIQDCATKEPAKAITGTVEHVPTGDSHHTAAGALSGVKAAAYYDGDTTIAVKGGDNETRPVNIYVAYYIKAKKG